MPEIKKNPTSIRLPKDLKAVMQMEAMRLDRALNWLIVSSLSKSFKTQLLNYKKDLAARSK